jgi:hypothetical protein
MTSAQPTSGPHQRISAPSPRERFALDLFDILWDRYRQRVSYVRDYEQLIARHGATFVNDHIAFRTLATQQPACGIASVSRLFEALGYQAAGCYHFPDKHLGAIHYQHPNPQFPKLFVSELKTWELPPPVQRTIAEAVRAHRPTLPDDLLAALAALDHESARRAELLAAAASWIQDLPWPPPEKQAVATLGAVSQYAAWVLVHGYNVNHFTSLINSHGKPELDDIVKTAAALRAAGVPMKNEIEGPPGSKLRQTATEAVMIEVAVREGGKPASMSWSYAYFELAERGVVTDPETGRPCRFEGFLGPQATNLFEMTRVN